MMLRADNITYAEVVGNLHNHTPYSDGAKYHADIASAALQAGLDFVIVTDHNVWVDGVQGYYESASGGQRLLLLTGEEIHDQTRQPQKNHLLVYGTQAELAHHAAHPQTLIDKVNEHGGLCFLAHPHDPAAPLFHEPDIAWESWDVQGYTGLEIWNYMSSFKGLLTSQLAAVRYAFNPELGIVAPYPDTLKKWDELLAQGRRVVGIGNADAHGTTYSLGPIKREIFPYEHQYRAVNTHLLLEKPLSGDLQTDAQAIYAALRVGRGYIAYGVPANPRGFRFTARTQHGTAVMGDEVRNDGGVTLQAAVPAQARLVMIHNGKVVRQVEKGTTLTHITADPGAYRVEAWIPFKGRERGWIFSNPIYVL